MAASGLVRGCGDDGLSCDGECRAFGFRLPSTCVNASTPPGSPLSHVDVRVSKTSHAEGARTGPPTARGRMNLSRWPVIGPPTRRCAAVLKEATGPKADTSPLRNNASGSDMYLRSEVEVAAQQLVSHRFLANASEDHVMKYLVDYLHFVTESERQSQGHVSGSGALWSPR